MSAALLIMGWPHRTSIEVFPRSASLRHRGKPHALTLPLHWRLVLSPPHLAPQCRYVAGLQSADGRFWQLLSGPRPDQILEELNQCNEVWPLKVESGWGLDSTAQPWKFGRLTVPVKRPVEAAARSLRAPRTDIQLPKVMTFLTVAVAALLLVQYLQGTNRHLNFNWASTLLPLLLVGQLVFAAFASSARSQMRCSSHAVYLRGGIFGSASKTVPRDAVRGVCLVGRSEAAEVCHLLLDTDHGPLASRVRSEAAKAFLREAEETLQIRN